MGARIHTCPRFTGRASAGLQQKSPLGWLVGVNDFGSHVCTAPPQGRLQTGHTAFQPRTWAVRWLPGQLQALVALPLNHCSLMAAWSARVCLAHACEDLAMYPGYHKIARDTLSVALHECKLCNRHRLLTCTAAHTANPAEGATRILHPEA
eukprot:366009-Chlamydomonas_euryale.AAC.39